jgi:hypothetical protein
MLSAKNDAATCGHLERHPEHRRFPETQHAHRVRSLCFSKICGFQLRDKRRSRGEERCTIAPADLPVRGALFQNFSRERNIQGGIYVRECQIHNPEQADYREVRERQKEVPMFSGRLGQGEAPKDGVATSKQ